MDASFRRLACKYMLKQRGLLVDCLKSARNADDAEGVHKARVASRRLRAAFRFFRPCLPSSNRKQWRKRVRQLTRCLGAARDRDVQILYLEDVLGTLSPNDWGCRHGIQRLLLRCRQAREALQPDVIKAIGRFETSDALGDMRRELKRMQLKNQEKTHRLQSPFVQEQARSSVGKRVDKLLAIQDCLNTPDAVAAHHKMRIAAKRLRYTLEICDVAFEKQLKEYTKVVKRVQTLLGDIHDCDVWQELLTTFSKDEESRIVEFNGHAGPFEQLVPGLRYLAQKRGQQRESRFAELREYWAQVTAASIWDQLLAKLESRSDLQNQSAETVSDDAIQKEAGVGITRREDRTDQ